MIRFIKRLWARLTHRHYWMQVNSVPLKMRIEEWYQGKCIDTYRLPIQWERCYCGKERAFVLEPKGKKRLDPDWVRETYAMMLVPQKEQNHDTGHQQ